MSKANVVKENWAGYINMMIMLSGDFVPDGKQELSGTGSVAMSGKVT